MNENKYIEILHISSGSHTLNRLLLGSLSAFSLQYLGFCSRVEIESNATALWNTIHSCLILV